MLTIATILLILSKIPDFHSTWFRISHHGQERNRIVRKIMQKTGPRTGLILAGMIYLAVVAVCHLLCLAIDNFWFDLQYLLSVIIATVFNLAVAHHNYTRRYNMFTRFVERTTGRYYSGR